MSKMGQKLDGITPLEFSIAVALKNRREFEEFGKGEYSLALLDKLENEPLICPYKPKCSLARENCEETWYDCQDFKDFMFGRK